MSLNMVNLNELNFIWVLIRTLMLNFCHLKKRLQER